MSSFLDDVNSENDSIESLMKFNRYSYKQIIEIYLY